MGGARQPWVSLASGWNGGPSKSPGPTILQELMIYAVSALFSFGVLTVGLRRLDPNRANTKKAAAHKKEIAQRLGRPSIETNVYEDVIAMDVVNPDDISVGFEDIGGMFDVKQALDELIILPLRRPELFQRGNLAKPVKGALLYGPPGTGKTMLAKALAKESGACFINVRVSALQSKWFGDAQKLVTAVFTLAWKLQPSIIFIDEVDSFLGQRKSSEHETVTNMKTEFMSLWDGFLTNDQARVMVLAATNRPYDVDEAILRRLPQTFEVPLPDAEQRASILEVLVRDEPLADGFCARTPNSPLMQLAANTEGFSGSDLQELCKHAAYRPIRDYMARERAKGAVATLEALSRGEGPASAASTEHDPSKPVQLRRLTLADFMEAIKVSRPPAEAAMRYMHKDASRKKAAQMNPAHQPQPPQMNPASAVRAAAAVPAQLQQLLAGAMAQAGGEGDVEAVMAEALVRGLLSMQSGGAMPADSLS